MIMILCLQQSLNLRDIPYSWVDIGSTYLMNYVSAAYLWGNLEKTNEIKENRLNS